MWWRVAWIAAGVCVFASPFEAGALEKVTVEKGAVKLCQTSVTDALIPALAYNDGENYEYGGRLFTVDSEAKARVLSGAREPLGYRAWNIPALLHVYYNNYLLWSDRYAEACYQSLIEFALREQTDYWTWRAARAERRCAALGASPRKKSGCDVSWIRQNLDWVDMFKRKFRHLKLARLEQKKMRETQECDTRRTAQLRAFGTHERLAAESQKILARAVGSVRPAEFARAWRNRDRQELVALAAFGGVNAPAPRAGAAELSQAVRAYLAHPQAKALDSLEDLLAARSDWDAERWESVFHPLSLAVEGCRPELVEVLLPHTSLNREVLLRRIDQSERTSQLNETRARMMTISFEEREKLAKSGVVPESVRRCRLTRALIERGPAKLPPRRPQPGSAPLQPMIATALE